MSALEIALRDLFRLVPEDESPVPESPGLRLGAGSAAWSDGRMRFELLVGWQLPEPFAASFADLASSIVLVLEDTSGRTFAARTVDPHLDRPIDGRPAWDGAAGASAPAPPFRGGWITVPLEVTVAPPAWHGPALYARVVLHEQLSSVLGFSVARGGVVSVEGWLAGAPYRARTHAEDEVSGPPPLAPPGAAPPATASPALGLAPRPGAARAFDARLRVTPDELAAGGAEGWLRSVVVCAVSRTEQLPFVASWLGERLVTADDMTVGPGGGVARLGFDLDALFGTLPPDTYDLHVSARHHCSPMLQVVIT